MKILAVGGGSGGHVTPVLAVINELAKLDRDLSVEFVCDKAFEAQSRGLMKQARVEVPVRTIVAGKLRRYHGESWLTRLFDVRTNLLNLRDIIFVLIGFLQSLGLMIRRRPDAVFAKGGYVCLPVGLASAILRIPLIIHDSDTRPGLTNKILGRFAKAIATGSPLENYNYDKNKTQYTGVPIQKHFRPLTPAEIRQARDSIGVIDTKATLVVVTGGGLGSKAINTAMVKSGPMLVEAGLHVYHVTGVSHFKQVEPKLPQHPHYIAVPFVYKDMHQVLGSADIVVSRASATFLQELAGLAKPSIVIPASHLGDQIKNAKVYAKAEATLVMSDSEINHSTSLGQAILDLAQDKARQKSLAKSLHGFARPHASRDVAKMIYQVVGAGAKAGRQV